MTSTMTKGEREDLIRLIKQRERVAKTAAEQRSSAMLAQFEREVSALHPFANNDVWRAAAEAVSDAVRAATEKIQAEADHLGIPTEFQPRIAFSWLQRGENSYEVRRTELRRVAKAEIDAMEKVARVQIEQASVNAQTEVIANGLSTPTAIEFLNKMPPIDTMMPALDITAIQAKLAERARQSGVYRGPHLIE
jgi:replicative superfamily II helicase